MGHMIPVSTEPDGPGDHRAPSATCRDPSSPGGGLTNDAIYCNIELTRSLTIYLHITICNSTFDIGERFLRVTFGGR